MPGGNNLAALILAAGEGTRMESNLAKVLHKICGKTMIRHVFDTVCSISPSQIIIVVGHQAEAVKAELEGEKVRFVLQAERLGTGHAVLMSEPLLKDFSGTMIVLNGDTPLLRPNTLSGFVDFHRKEKASATVLSAVLSDPTGYGRIIRDGEGEFVRIVEEKDADGEERTVKEINSGLFCFERPDLSPALRKVSRRNVQSEYYITDVMEIMRKQGKRVAVYVSSQKEEVLGINNLEQLRIAEKLKVDHG